MGKLKVFAGLFFDYEFRMYFKKYTIGENHTIISPKDLEIVSTRGYEYVVFKYNDLVLKMKRLERFGIPKVINVNTLKSLSNLPLKRIVLPNDFLYDFETEECVGYSQRYIGSESSILDESMDHFINACVEVYKEVEYLSKMLITIYDMHEGNFIYDGQINIIDLGGFTDCKLSLPKNIKFKTEFQKMEFEQVVRYYPEEIETYIANHNTSEINDFFIKAIIKDCCSAYKDDLAILFKTLMKESNIESTVDYFAETAKHGMTVSEYLLSRKNKEV